MGQINPSILWGKCPTGRENITFSFLVFWHKAINIVWRIVFFSFSFFFRIFMPGNRWLFFQRGFKGEFILSRPRRQISGIESLFSIRTPSLRTTFAPSSRRNWYWRSQFAILFRPCLPPFTLFDPCLRRQTEGHAATIMADRDSLAFHFLYFISLSLFLSTLFVIFEKHDALFRLPPIKHNSNIRTCSLLRCKGWRNYGLSSPPPSYDSMFDLENSREFLSAKKLSIDERWKRRVNWITRWFLFGELFGWSMNKNIVERYLLIFDAIFLCNVRGIARGFEELVRWWFVSISSE